MRHAGDESLNRIEPLLARLRAIPGLRERKRGIFYRGSSAFLHFHEDPAGLYADLKVGDQWQRMKADTPEERVAILAAARQHALPS
jgi:hypothetical protein